MQSHLHSGEHFFTEIRRIWKMNFSNVLMRRGVLLATLLLTLGVLAISPVTEAQAQGEPFMELLRQDIQADKVALMTVAMELTEEDAEKFWPLYREYQTELSKIGDGRVKLIKEFAANYDSMTEDAAKEISKKSFDLKEDQFKLLKKTHKNVSKAIGHIQATRFAQIENQLMLLIDIQIAAELPLIK